MRSKTMTARALRDVLNALPDASLDMPVQWWGEERGGYVGAVEALAEDHYDPSGDGCEPVSLLRECHENNKIEGDPQTFDEWLVDEGEPIARAGQVIVFVDEDDGVVPVTAGEAKT